MKTFRGIVNVQDDRVFLRIPIEEMPDNVTLEFTSHPELKDVCLQNVGQTITADGEVSTRDGLIMDVAAIYL